MSGLFGPSTSSAGVAEAGGDAVDGEEEGSREVGDSIFGAVAVGGLLAPALEQAHLEVVKWGEVVVADAEGAGEVGVRGEKLGGAGQAQDFADGQLVLFLDRAPGAGQVGGDEAVDVVGGDLEVGLEEGHLDVGEEGGEEAPAAAVAAGHRRELVVEARGAGRRQAAADAEPAGDDLAALGPAEDPGDRAQGGDAAAPGRPPR